MTPMSLALPTRAVSDWHIVVRYTVYPERAKLSAATYRFAKEGREPSVAVFSPRILHRPEELWDVIQGLSLGVDLIAEKMYP